MNCHDDYVNTFQSFAGTTKHVSIFVVKPASSTSTLYKLRQPQYRPSMILFQFSTRSFYLSSCLPVSCLPMVSKSLSPTCLSLDPCWFACLALQEPWTILDHCFRFAPVPHWVHHWAPPCFPHFFRLSLSYVPLVSQLSAAPIACNFRLSSSMPPVRFVSHLVFHGFFSCAPVVCLDTPFPQVAPLSPPCLTDVPMLFLLLSTSFRVFFAGLYVFCLPLVLALCFMSCCPFVSTSFPMHKHGRYS